MARGQQSLSQIELKKLQGKPLTPDEQRLADGLARQLLPGQQEIARKQAETVNRINKKK